MVRRPAKTLDEPEASKDELRALVTEGLTSPPGRPWGEFKADLMARAQAQPPKPAKQQK